MGRGERGQAPVGQLGVIAGRARVHVDVERPAAGEDAPVGHEAESVRLGTRHRDFRLYTVPPSRQSGPR
jgi:hypothetical protein